MLLIFQLHISPPHLIAAWAAYRLAISINKAELITFIERTKLLKKSAKLICLIHYKSLMTNPVNVLTPLG